MGKASLGPNDISIERATTEDLPAVLTLLKNSGLPQDEVAEHVGTMIVAREGKRVVGSAALELYGDVALLRSVAVVESLRGRGIGRRLTHFALDLAQKRGVASLYLLTETASEFFSRFGFRPVNRSEVPLVLHQSIEFASACPVSAMAMMMQVRQ